MSTPNIALQVAASNPAISFAYLNPLDTTAACLAWFDMRLPGNYVAAGGTASELYDLSGHGNNLVQAASGNQPPLAASILPGVEAIQIAAGSTKSLVGPLGAATNFINSTAFTVSAIVTGVNAGGPNQGLALSNMYDGGMQGWGLGFVEFYTGSQDVSEPQLFLTPGYGVGGSRIQVKGGASAMVTGANNFVRITYDGSGVAAGVKIYIGEALQTPTVVADSLGGGPILSAALNALVLGVPSNALDPNFLPFLAGCIHAGAIAAGSADAITLHTYAQQQFGCA